MRTTNNNRKSKFLAFLLSVMMISTAGAMFASCADGDDSSSTSSTSEETKEEEETKTDEGDIKNANFDFTKLDKKTVIGTSVTGWSRSVNSSDNASKSASGVIDTSEASWDYMTGAAKDVSNMTEADAIKDWDTFNVQTKLAYYKKWKEDNKGKTLSASTFEKYESINVDEEDIPTVNPGTHDAQLDTNVLMIHNHYYPDSNNKDKLIGTAQKWTSSSTVTIPAGSSAQVSVWVKTAELEMAATGTPTTHGTVDAVGKGAYISLTHSVGGKSLDAYEVKNIDVDEWTQYTFYIKGSNYADTTYSLVLGLGQGNTDNRFDYVNGYAFFDDIQCEIIDNDTFDEKTENNTTIADLDDEKLDKTFDAYEMPDAKVFGMDFSTQWNTVDFNTITVETTEDKVSKNPEASDKDVVGVYTKADLKTKSEEKVSAEENAALKNSNLNIVYDKFLANVNENSDEKDNDEKNATFLGANDDVFMMLSNNGTAYTVENVVDAFTLPAGQDYMAISFFVKTSNMNGGTGAGVTLVDDLKKTSFTSIDTSSITAVEIGEDKDAYDGWQQVFFFVERAEDVTGDITFSLTFNYGPTEITSSTADTNFQQGFAAFTKFTSYSMTELEYDAATTNTYAKKVTVYGVQDDEAAGNNGFDTPAGVPENALEDGLLANPQNYKGVYNDSYRVSLPTAIDTTNKTPEELEAIEEKKAEQRAFNQYDKAGLLNREYYAKFLENQGVTVTEEEAAAQWKASFGDATQPLIISNEGLTNRSYGFIGTTKTLSDEYTAVSLRVMTMGGATASIYLMDMSDDTRQTVLSVSRSLTYWYDTDGNICTGDPAKKSSVIAFKLDKNGLYKANKNWENYEKLGEMKDEYFANLNAYTEKNGVLYANDNSASHDYYDYTWNREVFYKNQNAWYTEKGGKGVKVNNLADITKDASATSSAWLEARFLPETKQELSLENIDTNGKWQTVTFYLRKGDTATSYRLEVWSGTRDGKTVCTTGGVAFDTNNPGTASSNFSALIEEFEDEATAKFESVFSYYDTDKHVRYDANLDLDKSGNAYADNIKATLGAESSMAFLSHYSDETGYNFFADYSLSNKTVAASEVDDSEDVEEEEEEEEPSEVNIWLLVSSIAIAGVLVLAVASILVRKIVEKARKKNGRKVRKVKEAKVPAQKKAEKNVDEDSPYND